MNTRYGKVICIFAIVLCAATAALATPDQPRMQQAREDLIAARASLQRAEHNKGGHRAKAIGYVNEAISQVNAGIQFDRRHNHANASLGFDQPNMRAALDHLNDAKRNLEAATADKGGHRAKAMSALENAISEVRAGIAAGN
jgi:hypothetical protein